MPSYRGQADIDAPIEDVWAVLVDVDRYPEWNSFTTRVRSSLEPGQPIWMRVDLGWITLWFRERVREVEAPRRLVWGLRVPGLLAAERIQTLEPTESGCRYETVDTIEGTLAPLVHGLFGRGLERGFRRVAEDLARRL